MKLHLLAPLPFHLSVNQAASSSYRYYYSLPCPLRRSGPSNNVRRDRRDLVVCVSRTARPIKFPDPCPDRHHHYPSLSDPSSLFFIAADCYAEKRLHAFSSPDLGDTSRANDSKYSTTYSTACHHMSTVHPPDIHDHSSYYTLRRHSTCPAFPL